MNGSDEGQPISAQALGLESKWTNFLPPVITAGTLVLTSCAQEMETATATTELFTTTAASQALEPWKSFNNGTQTGEMVSLPNVIMSPDDVNGTKIWSFHAKNSDGTENKDVDYGFAKALVKTDGQMFSATFLLKHVESAKSTTAYLLLLDKDTPTQKVYAAGEIGSDNIAHLAPFSFVINLDPKDPKNTQFAFKPVDSAGFPLVATAQPTEAAAKVYDVAFQLGNTEGQPPITLTATPDTGSTATSTVNPTEIPLTPTETPDPNMPPGATGKDADGNYTRTLPAENGKRVTETWRTIPTGNNGETMTGWFVDHVIDAPYKGGIPLIDQPADGYNQLISLHFGVKDGIQAPFIHHTNNLDSSSGLNFTRLLYTTLEERYFGKNFLKISYDDQLKFGKDWREGKISFPVTDANGHTVNLAINENTRVNINLVNPEDIKTPDFVSTNYLSVTTFDNEKTVTITVASKKPLESNTKRDFSDLLLFSLMRVFINQNQTQEFFNNNFFLFSRAGQLDELAIKGQNPLFEIIETP